MDFVNKKLDEFENYIRGKRVAIIGLGVSNIPLIDYFHNLGASVAFFDKRPVEKLDKEAVQKIHNYNFDLYLGENNLENLKGFSVIFRSPSCRPDTPEIVDEVRKGTVLTSEIEMLMQTCPATIIGITGSDGKTTTTSSGVISLTFVNNGNPIFPPK